MQLLGLAVGWLLQLASCLDDGFLLNDSCDCLSYMCIPSLKPSLLGSVCKAAGM